MNIVVASLVCGTTEVSLSNLGRAAVLSYSPAEGGEGETAVTESLVVRLRGRSLADITSIKNSITRVFAKARERKTTRNGDRAYINLQPAGYSSTYRSEIYSGQCSLSDTVFSKTWNAYIVELTIAWTRAAWWEAADETEVSLSNTHGSGTGGITVYNHDDGSQDNTALIASTAITGDLPAPCRLELYNSFNSVNNVKKLWVAHNWRLSPSSLPHILEAEDASGGTPTANASCSNGSFNGVSWAATTETVLLTWNLDGPTLLDYAKGGHVAFLMRWHTPPTADFKLRLKITDATTGITLWTGEQVTTTGDAIQELGASRLPPSLLDHTGQGDLSLVLTGEREEAGTHSMNIDFVQITPLDGLRVYSARLSGELAYQSTLVDDAMVGALYSITSSLKYEYFTVEGQPILLMPGEAQKLYLLAVNDADGAEINRTWTLRVYYRPRRASL